MTTFQRETVRKGLKLYGRVLINDDSGIGKSLEGLGLALAYRHEWPLLIVCPNFCKYHWRHEVLKWLPGFELKRI
jgi:SWI/SNF-related matrix-associated actin-dependent regulator 1 of chromatin subfamily A